jgi:cAMP-dependent protein kinase regulator
LNAKELEIVIGAMEEKKFAAGDVIIKQGDEGNNLFVVDTGSLTCVRVMVNF